MEEPLVEKEKNRNRRYSRRFTSRDFLVDYGCAQSGLGIERPLARTVHETAIIQAKAFHSLGEGFVPQLWYH